MRASIGALLLLIQPVVAVRAGGFAAFTSEHSARGVLYNMMLYPPLPIPSEGFGMAAATSTATVTSTWCRTTWPARCGST